MPLMTWNDKLSVGVSSLDADHKELVGMVNEMYDGIQAGHGKEAVGKILDRLIAYTVVHFAREEKYFAETDYPSTAAHQKEHADLAQQVLEIQKKYNAGTTSILSLEVMNFLRNWLLHHIQGSDKRYSTHLTAHGIK